MTGGGAPDRLHVLDAGLATTVQDTPGRLGYWMVGVPPSGAMDDLSMRLVNRIVANDPGAAGLECTVNGPTLRFDTATVVALGGAHLAATLDGRPVPYWSPIDVPAGAVLRIGARSGPGMRAYLAVRGGLDVPEVLGSRATFDLGRFGGHRGRPLAAGDGLPVGGCVAEGLVPSPLPPDCWPELTHRWTIGVTEGPHGAPDFLTSAGFEAIVDAVWTVQRHAARTGVRLDGPVPAWARSDGGDAGLHPSNIHDSGYAFGAVDFTGDTPVVLGPDGPSLGGFTTPAVVVAAERWKLGQVAPGDEVRFVVVDGNTADGLRKGRSERVRRLRDGPSTRLVATAVRDGGVLARVPAGPGRPALTCRRAGDDFVLAEYGDMVLDLALRARVHALEALVVARTDVALIDTTPGVRSLLVHFDPSLVRADDVVGLLCDADDDVPPSSQLTVDSRIVRLPLSWEDPATTEAVRRYMDHVRPDAPWCPSNLEFIRRINGLESVDDVRRIVFDASYLVVGLGDVYLGAPVATPLDPRHRLVTTKYNPARTWTPENAVGIGGAYLCVYGMEGPGGYQFVGRTIPVWYLDAPTPGPEPDVPWMLRPFDQLRFHPVGADELLDLRRAARAGDLDIAIEPASFSLAAHQERLAEDADGIAAFRTRQQEAFAAERAAWRSSGELST